MHRFIKSLFTHKLSLCNSVVIMIFPGSTGTPWFKYDTLTILEFLFFVFYEVSEIYGVIKKDCLSW
jgi:hypothetical protein